MVEGALRLTARRRRRTCWGRAATPTSRPARRWTLRNTRRTTRRDSTGSARPTSGSTGSTYRRRSSPTSSDVDADRDARHQRRVDDDRASSTPTDLRHDMHVNIVNFEPGGAIPFPETHVMEHGLYVLEGKAVYLLNQRLGRGRGRRLHVAARVLPAGLLRRRPGPVPLPALQGRQPARPAAAGSSSERMPHDAEKRLPKRFRALGL